MAVFGFKFGGGATTLQKLAAGKFKSEEEKQALLTALAEGGGPAPVDLVPLLFSEDAAVLQRSAALFLNKADERGVAGLVQELLERAGPGRGNAVKILTRVRPELLKTAVDVALEQAQGEQTRKLWDLVMELPSSVGDSYLERALKVAPPQTRLLALKRLLKSRQPEGMRAVLLETMGERDVKVRLAAVEALATLTGDDIFAAMLDRLSTDDNSDVCKAAGAFLQKFITSAPPELRPSIMGKLLLAGAPESQKSLVESMFASGNTGDLLLEILTFCKTVTGARHKAIMSALKHMGDSLLQRAIQLLQHADADVRIQAVLLIESFGDPRCVGNLLQMLRDPDWWLRIMVCETLGRLKDPRVIPSLQQMLFDADSKWAAIDAIGSLGGDAALTCLAGLLKDPQVEVRLAAVTALRKTQDARAEKVLTEVSERDASVDVKLRAVDCLRELRGGGEGKGAVVTSAQLTRPMEKLLAYARERGASDLHLTPGEPPVIRVDGVLERLESKKIDAEQTSQLLTELLDPVRKPILEKTGAADFCYPISGVGRYRANIFKMKRGLGGVFRCIPNVPPTFVDLLLPKHLNDITTYHQGIILVTGPAGSGKSTTLTALVNVINETRNSHVLTFEDPVEFLHPPRKALINQREIGKDSESYAAAMRGALREDPDVVVVGELRDPETIQLALMASETGHLVVATMQTNSAVATIDKLVESFPTAEQQQVRVSLSESLKLIVSQSLVPRAGGKGRVALFEILKSTSPVRSLIRDGKTFQLPSTMTISRSAGMQTLDGSIEERLAEGLITLETAIAHAEKKDEFLKRKLSGAPPAEASADGSAPPPADGAAAAAAAVAKPGASGAARPGAPGAPGGMARPAVAGARPPAAPGQPGAPGARPGAPGAPGAARPAAPGVARPPLAGAAGVKKP